MLNDCRLILTFSVRNRFLILHYWMMVKVLCYSLLGHWFLPGVNALTLVHRFTHHYSGRFASNGRPFICYSLVAPLFLCRLSSGWAKEYGKSVLGGSPYSCPKILVPSYLLWGDISVSWSPRSMLVLAACVCFPWLSHTLNSFPFLSKSLLIFFFFFFFIIHLSLESETKGEFLHLLYSKTLFPSLMVDFASIKKETPSVSFFFARLGVFLESFSGRRPHVGLFIPRDCGAFRLVLISLYPLLR